MTYRHVDTDSASDVLDAMADYLDEPLPSIMAGNLQKMYRLLHEFGDHDDPLVQELIMELEDRIEETGVV